MENDPQPTLEERLQRLERAVTELQRAVVRGAAAPVGSPAAAPVGSPAAVRVTAPRAPGTAPAAGSPSASPTDRPSAPPGAALDPGQTGDWRDRGESLLARGGVVLLLFGLAFLFKYAVDRGWITPTIRCAFGFGVGSAMTVLGLRLHATRRRYSQILLGGSIAVFYLVAFAAAPLYHLVPDAAAFLFMDLVSAMALVLAEREDEPLLALIGIAGAAATPALLGSWAPNGRVLLLHTALLALWTSRLHVRTGWRAIPWAAAAATTVLLLGTLSARAPGRPLAFAVAALVWLAIGVAPLAWLETDERDEPRGRQHLDSVQPRVLAVAFTFLVAALAASLWPGSGPRAIGAALMAAACVYGTLSAIRWTLSARVADEGTRPAGKPILPVASAAAADVAAALLLLGTALSFAGAEGVALLSIEATALVGLGWRLRSDNFALLGAITFTGLAVALAQRAAIGGTGPLSAGGLAFVLAIALAALIAWRAERRTPSGYTSLGYGVGAYAGLLLWMVAELRPLPNHALLVSLGWGICGATSLVVGVDRDRPTFQKVGLATLAMTAGKLILVDMAQVEAVWRILLFIGFGAMFLGLSYYLKGRAAAGRRPMPADEGQGPAGR